MVRLSPRTAQPVRHYKTRPRTGPPIQLPITSSTRFIVSVKRRKLVYDHYWTGLGSISYEDLKECNFHDYDVGNYAVYPIHGARSSCGKLVFGKTYQYIYIYYDTHGKKWIEKFDKKGNRIVKMVLK